MTDKRNTEGLTKAQQRFCDAYLADPARNGARVYRQLHPGIKEPTARANAARMLANANVASYIERKEAAMHQKLVAQYGTSEENIVRELAAIAFARLTDFMEWDENGIRIWDSRKLEDMQQRGIVEIRQTKEGIHVKLKKLEALTKLGERLGLFKRNEVSSGVTVYLNHDTSLVED